MSIAHRQPLNVRMQCTTPTVMHSGRRYKASRPFKPTSFTKDTGKDNPLGSSTAEVSSASTIC